MKSLSPSTRRFLAAGLLVVNALIPTAGGASSVIPIAVPELARAADVIVLGTVRSTRVESDPGGKTFTAVEVQPAEVLKGTTAGTVVVRQLGGVTATGGSLVSGSATFAPGECVLLFLRRAGADLRLLGEAQGKFSVGRDASGSAWTANRVDPDTGRVLDRVPLERIKELLARPSP